MGQSYHNGCVRLDFFMASEGVQEGTLYAVGATKFKMRLSAHRESDLL